MFQPVDGSADFPRQEEDVLRFWKEQRVYEKSLAQRKQAPRFVFYEGPPTANGLPHPGHCLTRAVKDLFPRYRTMRGYRCDRKAGWDTHGLPVEVEVCKELGIHSKEEIEAFGIEPFIQKCQHSVWRYMQQWERLTERLGFWVDLQDAYVTYHQSYVESVWWSLKVLFDSGRLYQGHKIVWWWAQGGTALSSGEVGQGYREVADPSVYVRCPLLDDSGQPSETSLLVWTTTPWTLPSNQFVAVHPELTYATVRDEDGGKLVIAEALVETLSQKVKRELVVEATCTGRDLVGRRYLPPFDDYYAQGGQQQGRLKSGGTQAVAWRIVAAHFVTTESGTGLVHEAPAFGEVDYEVLAAEQARFVDGQGPSLICAVGPDGKFTADVPAYEGRWVKDCDKELTRALRDAGKLFHQEQYLHDYPFCWRAEDDPLIQYPRESWFVRTTEQKQAMLANNAAVHWLPDHIQTGRFGKFLETNVDWALSRERYWGTPLPIWECDETGYQEAIGSYEELQAKPAVDGFQVWEQAKATQPELPEDLKVHKPYIDAVSYQSPRSETGRMRRVSEVIDCWYDSGAMPFAQWGYRGQSSGAIAERFREQFPADFISEAIDQTRGWFYSLLAISTALFGEASGRQGQDSQPLTQAYPHPFENCIVLGLMLSEWWESKDGSQLFLSEQEADAALGKNQHRRVVGKMSKSKRNYPEPQEIFDHYGADALRWYFFATQPPWTTIRYSEQAIKDSVPEFLLRLWNVYSFFVIYANIDGFDPAERIPGQVGQLDPEVLRGAKGYRPIAQRSELDRWIVSLLHETSARVVDCMDQYDNYNACQSILGFVDALSNWYVRRSRDRFWMADKQAPEKLDAYWTLYECLLTTCRIVAPFVPFISETIWQNIVRSVFGTRALLSVHLAEFPQGISPDIDPSLTQQMELIREIASLGRAARSGARIKVRQPLSKVEVVLADTTHLAWLREHAELIAVELNVKAVEFTDQGEQYITYSVVPNFKQLGPRLGKNMPVVKKMLGERDGGELLAELRNSGRVTLELPAGETIELDETDIEVRLSAVEGWSAAEGRGVVVVLATELTDELIAEGIANDAIRLIQDRRKELGCEFTDRIEVGFVALDDADEVLAAIQTHEERIRHETLGNRLVFERLTATAAAEVGIGEVPLELYVRVAE